MKRKIGMELISKELLISAGIGVIIGILVLSYASNNNFTKLEKTVLNDELHDELSVLANKILTTTEITNKGILNSLASKVMAANKALDKEDTETAIQSLEDLISPVTDQRGKKIPSGEADVLIGLAVDAIIELIGLIECDPMCIDEACVNEPPELRPQCAIDACSPGGACYP